MDISFAIDAVKAVIEGESIPLLVETIACSLVDKTDVVIDVQIKSDLIAGRLSYCPSSFACILALYSMYQCVCVCLGFISQCSQPRLDLLNSKVLNLSSSGTLRRERTIALLRLLHTTDHQR